MPWKERTVYKMREEFVRRAQAKQKSMSALCREYGITRRTGYKWLKRAEAGEQLEDRSRRPKRIHRITAEMVELVKGVMASEGVGAVHGLFCRGGHPPCYVEVLNRDEEARLLHVQ